MRDNPTAAWELRLGQLRVYFDIDEPARIVTVRAVGLKRRNRVFIGGKELPL